MPMIIDMKGTPQGKDAIPTGELKKLFHLFYRLGVMDRIVHLYDVGEPDHMMDAMRYILSV